MASSVLNLGVCSPFSSRTRVTRPMSAERASASWVSPADSLNPRTLSPQRTSPLDGYRLDGRPVGLVAVVAGEVPRNLNPIAEDRDENHLIATVFSVKRKELRMSNPYLPRCAMLEHSVQDDEQFAHTRDQSQLLRFASRQQLLVEVPDHGVPAGRGQCPHVKDAPYSGATAPDGAFAPQSAAVPVLGSHAHQGGDLPAVQRAQLRQVGQQSEGDLFSHAGNGA